MNFPPPPIDSDPLVAGSTPIEELLALLGMAANADDAADYAESLDEHAGRDSKATEAAEKFTAHDSDAATQLAQQLPQLASGLAGALSGGLGGILGPVTQIPQQFGQALQTGLGAFGPALTGSRLGASPENGPLWEPGDAEVDDVGDDLGVPDEPDESDANLGVPGGGFSSGLGGGPADRRAGTAPTAAGLAPPSITAAGAAPASVPATPAPVTGGALPGPGGAMAGMPIPPPGGVNPGADRDAKTETKRITAPSVRNGAPVQGRITVPPAGPVDDTKPFVTRRFLPPGSP